LLTLRVVKGRYAAAIAAAAEGGSSDEIDAADDEADADEE
jgi:hypothetical protein